MRKILLAAATVLTMASVPAFAQSDDCKPGTMGVDGTPVTCDNDDNVNDTTNTPDDSSTGPMKSQGDSVLDSTEAGQGVKDAVSGGDGNGGGNGDGNN